MKLQKIGIKFLSILKIGIVFALIFLPGQGFSGVISSEKIEKELLDYAKTRFEKEGTEIEISVGSVRDIEILSEDNPEFRIIPLEDINLRRIVPMVVEVMGSDGKIIRKMRYALRLRVYMDVVSASNNIKRGEKITEDDIVIKKTDITGLEMFYRSAEEAEGLEAKTEIRPGTVLSNLNIRPQFVINRGDKVSVEVKSGNIFLRADGIARENGVKGGEIKVFVNMAKTIIKCRVVDSETVIAES